MAILDLIEHADEYANEIVARVPESGSGEFRLGSQLVVRESQRAVFFRDGKALDLFGAGRHTLSTNNIPLLTGLLGIPFGGNSPFRAEVYFVAMREFTDMKWGTAQPAVYRDSVLGMVRLRAFGSYSMRVADPQLFVNQIVGTRGSYTTGAIEDFLRNIILTEFTDILGSVQTSILDLPAMTSEIATTVRNALGSDFGRLGLELTTFQITSITPPEEVQKRIDERSGMGALGDMQQYLQYKTAQAIGDAANNPGTAGDATAAGVGLGAGLGLGQAMAQTMRDTMSPAPPAPAATVPPTPTPPAAAPAAPAPAVAAPAAATAPEATATKVCPNCQAEIPADARYCPNCGHQQP